MKITLIAVRLERHLTEEEWARILLLIPPERRERLAALRERTRAEEALCAWAALRRGLGALYGRSELPTLTYNEYGKPCFADQSGVHFNLSHTRGAALVGIHDQPLGVDIERIRPVSGRLLRRFAEADERAFFERWTQRESRIKQSGIGLAALRETESPPLPGERVIPVETFPDYAACVCTHSGDPLGEVCRLSPCDLF